MRNNWVREKLNSGEAVVGAQMGLGSPHVAELLSYAGYDWLVIETEHNGLDSAEIDLIEKWGSEGYLPTFALLMERGSWRKLKSRSIQEIIYFY